MLERKPECVCNVRTEPVVVECKGRQAEPKLSADVWSVEWQCVLVVAIVSLVLGFWLGRISCSDARPSSREVQGSRSSDPILIAVGSLEAARRRARAISG